MEHHALEREVGGDEPERPDRTVDDGLRHLVNLKRGSEAAREIAPTIAVLPS